MTHPSVVWESVKFDGSAHRSAAAVDLGTTGEGRWLSISAGTPMRRPDGRGYDHPCDAVALIPPAGLWTATWLIGWEPELYVDIARPLRNEPGRVVTMDLDLDVVRERDGSVRVLDRDEYDLHREHFGYPDELVVAVDRTVAEIEAALRGHQVPFTERPPVAEARGGRRPR